MKTIHLNTRKMLLISAAMLFATTSSIMPVLFSSKVYAALSAPQITRSPGGADKVTAVPRASFEFTSTQSGAQFDCRLDNFAWEICQTGKGYSNIPNGTHTFQVRAFAIEYDENCEQFGTCPNGNPYYTVYSPVTSYTWRSAGEVKDDIIPGDVNYGGTVMAVHSSASTLVHNDHNGMTDVFVGLTDRGYMKASSTLTGGGANGISFNPKLDRSGLLVAFETRSTNLVSNDTNGVDDILIRNLYKNTLDRITNSAGQQIGPVGGINLKAAATQPSVSANGAKVAYTTYYGISSSNGTANSKSDVYIYDVQQKKTVTHVGEGYGASISRNGRYVAFTSPAKLLPADTNGQASVYVRDTTNNALFLVSVGNNGAQLGGTNQAPDISENGRYITFESWGNNPAFGDNNNFPDVYVRDFSSGITTWVSKGGNKGSYAPSISGLQRTDGSFSIAYESDASTLCGNDGCTDLNNKRDVMQWIGTNMYYPSKTIIQSRKEYSLTATSGTSSRAIMSPDGSFVMFQSNALDSYQGNEIANIDTHMRGWSPYNIPTQNTTTSKFSTPEPTLPGTMPAQESGLPGPLPTSTGSALSRGVGSLMGYEDAAPATGQPNYGADDLDGDIGGYYAMAFLGGIGQPDNDPDSWRNQFWGAHEAAMGEALDEYNACIYGGDSFAFCELYARIVYARQFAKYSDEDWLALHGIDPNAGPVESTAAARATVSSTSPTRIYCP